MWNLIPVDEIEPNSWNPNVMSDAEFQTLKQDMHIHGVHGVDPILISPKGVYELPVPIDELPGGAWDKAFTVKGYVIVDGEHRWRAAKELGWKEILEDAGTRMGLLDYRPQHKGWFGTFSVESFKMQSAKPSAAKPGKQKA